MKKIFSSLSAMFLILALCLTFAGCDMFRIETYEPKFPDSSIAGKSYGLNINQSADRVYDRLSAVERVERSVVAIKMEVPTTSGSTSTSYGSGVIVDNADANDNIFYVLTCFHVIDSKGDITVYIPDMNTRNFTDDDYDDKFAFKGKISNTLSSGDEIIARKNREAKVGDIVIISGEREDAYIIKRVIAVGGQTVKIEDGYVFVDGVKIDEPYLDSQGQTKAHLWQERTLKEDEIFFLGDNRLNSEDSRGKYGTCKESQIAGVVPNWVRSLKGVIKIFI